MFKGFLTPVTKRHVERTILKTNPMHLFRIIQNVDAYSSFLPMCSASQVLHKSTDGRSFQATLTVGFPPLFQETYVSDVRINPDTLTIDTTSVQSKLFDSLHSQWKLAPVVVQDATDATATANCQVEFSVEITASDPLIIGTLDQVLREVAGQQVTAFDKRCRQVPMLPADLIAQDATVPKQ